MVHPTANITIKNSDQNIYICKKRDYDINFKMKNVSLQTSYDRATFLIN